MINFKDSVYYLTRRNNPCRQTAVSFSFLGKLNPISRQQLQVGKQYLQKMLLDSKKQSSISKSPLIIGLAESGIIPSALMHQIAREEDIQAHWVCSTRRDVSGIYFSESHSHQPDHVLPLYQYQPTEIWLVEDEITTGKTILNLILKLCPLLKVNSIRLFAFLDTRTQEETAYFLNTLNLHGIQCFTQSLIHSEKASKGISKSKTMNTKSYSRQLQSTNTTGSSQADYSNDDWHYPEQRAALNAQLNPVSNLPTHLTGCLLAIGEVVDLALRLLQFNPGLLMQHVTLSPWEIDGVKIFNYLKADKFHIYNYKQLQSHIYILSDPLERDIECKIAKLLQQQGLTVKSLSLNPVRTENQYAAIK